MQNKLKIISFLLLVFGIIFSSNYLLKIEKTEAREPTEITNLSGFLEEIHIENIINGTTPINEFYIRTPDNNRYRLFATNEENLQKNRKIVIKQGLMIDDKIYGEVSSLELEIEAIPDIVSYNGSSTIKWQVKEADTCNGTNGSSGWSGPKNIEGGEFVASSLTANTTFTITCQNEFDTASKSVTVTVVTPNPNTYMQNFVTTYNPENTEPEAYELAIFLVNPVGINPPFSINQAEELIFNGQIQDFIKEASYNKKYLDGDIFGWINADITSNSQECSENFVPLLEDDSVFNIEEVVNYINTNSINLANYGHVVFIMNCDNLGGASTIGKVNQIFNEQNYEFSRTKINFQNNASFVSYNNALNYPHQFDWTNFDQVFSHEIIHAFGSRHAGGLDCDLEILSNNCNNEEYGNTYDVMGRGNFSLHPNAVIKKLLNWIEYPQLLTITQSGTYTINMLEYRNGFQAAKIKNPTFVEDNIEYFIERRVGSGFDRTLNYLGLAQNQNGLMINQYDKDSPAFSSSYLLDANPTNENWSLDTIDAALIGNNTFTDTERGITIGPIINAADTHITFQVGITPASNCVRNNPTFTTTSPYTYDLSEVVREIRIRITNNDSLECGNSEFSAEALAITNGIVNLPYEEVTIAAQGQRNISWLNDIPLSTTPGSYTFKVTVKNTEYPTYKSEQTIVVNVVE